MAPVRHISHFSGTGFLANAFFRLAKPELAAGWLQKSLFRHPCVKRPTSAKPNSRVSRMNEKYLTMLSLLNVEKKEKFGKLKDITSAPFFANIPSLNRTILFPFFLFLRICDFPWPLRAFTSLFFSFHYSSSYTDETAERARYALCWMLLEITRRFSKGALFRVNVALSNFSTD